MSYYNTTNESGEALKESTVKAKTQTEKVLNIFTNQPGAIYTPFEIQRRIDPMPPVTSCRRAMTDLTKEGLLEKTDKQRMGEYGKLTYCWKLKTQEGQTTLNF